MRSLLNLAAILAVAAVSSQCGGGDKSSSGTPTTPGNTTPQVVTVAIVGIKGNQSYQPNPVAKLGGEQVVFQNNDSVVHHIVMDDGSADFGNLNPGAASQAKAVTNSNFHCLNHPSMVGTVNGATLPEPPVGSGDGY
jgi:plastocyanin